LLDLTGSGFDTDLNISFIVPKGTIDMYLKQYNFMKDKITENQN